MACHCLVRAKVKGPQVVRMPRPLGGKVTQPFPFTKGGKALALLWPRRGPGIESESAAGRKRVQDHAVALSVAARELLQK